MTEDVQRFASAQSADEVLGVNVSPHRPMWRVVSLVGNARCARYFHKWERTEIGWPYEEYWYCARWTCHAKTWDEERAEYGPLRAMRFDLERVGIFRRVFRWYDQSRFAL